MGMKRIGDAGREIIGRESGAQARDVKIGLGEIAVAFRKHSLNIFLGFRMMDELRLQFREDFDATLDGHVVLNLDWILAGEGGLYEFSRQFTKLQSAWRGRIDED